VGIKAPGSESRILQAVLYSCGYKDICPCYTIYNIQYTIYNIQYTIYNIQYTIYNIQYTSMHAAQEVKS